MTLVTLTSSDGVFSTTADSAIESARIISTAMAAMQDGEAADWDTITEIVGDYLRNAESAERTIAKLELRIRMREADYDSRD